MSYCPEDGTKMKTAGMGTSHICYDCPACGSHWCYESELHHSVGYLFVDDRKECAHAALHETHDDKE